MVHENHLYVLGGGTSFESHGFDEIPSFNIVTKKWSWVRTRPDQTEPVRESALEQFPEPRRCHCVVKHDHCECVDHRTQMIHFIIRKCSFINSLYRFSVVYLLGGYDGEEIFGCCWRLDLDTMKWAKLPKDLPMPVYFHSATITPVRNTCLLSILNETLYNLIASSLV